nr:hypothetical protein [Tanacetum cinerariifolium]
MHTIGMAMQQVQVNTKFLNALRPKWSKFVRDVKLAKSLYITNYDQLEGHLAKQCTQPKWLRNSAWFKEKLMLVEAQEEQQDHSPIEEIQLEITVSLKEIYIVMKKLIVVVDLLECDDVDDDKVLHKLM